MSTETKEPQNQSQIDDFRRLGPCEMGPWTSHIWRTDPRHLSFLTSRYKFVSKMLADKGKVCEIGCGDAFGLPIVLQTVSSIHGIDFEPLVLNDARARYAKEGNNKISFSLHDMSTGPVPGFPYDAAYSLDVIEHVPKSAENIFVDNIAASLKKNGVLIMGTPNITADVYASPASKAGHINLKSGTSLKELLERRFNNVFLFSMNDEIVHTGFTPMAHYLFALAVGVKE